MQRIDGADMRLLKRKRYYFTDSSVASDTVIAYVFGGVAFAMELAGVISSVVTKGDTPDICAYMYICSVFMSATGLSFAFFGTKAQEGGEKGKRFSIMLNVITLIIPIAIVVMGALK